ncbi:toll/interleukin-1 receptor domain-containing protein [Dyadobacter psychrotolerans]|uniref:Toll/interleukin-1 receptor domain-containing protein n=1 Tax=Dyadobacter psychrotolerans TaxID=2541721 RepID=A0A4R5DY89_9BACT|nr:toll/interleukin-1 receptor domain-containing protein [Dyadobacter psychrotolerans]TDE17684.1 toll/interleukin-1 receptor domain-containing protein [Dyadobacter psychrotolerans]
MTPRQKLKVYQDLATTILSEHSFEQAKNLLSMYGLSMEWTKFDLPPEAFLVDTFLFHDPNSVFEMAKDYEVEIPLEDAKTKSENNQNESIVNSPAKKIFISHSSQDRDVVGKLIDYLRAIGVSTRKIFCTSYEDYGIPLGEDFLEKIKKEISSETLVLFVLTDNFYASPVSLCEMGAAWVNSKDHIPILVPPFDFIDIKGVIPNTQGMKINEKPKLNSLKSKLEIFFELDPISFSIWERERDEIFSRMDAVLQKRATPIV